VSGAYIGVDVGHSNVPQRHFDGLEVPPVVTSGLTGREFVLEAEDIGSLSIGSEVLFRHIPAGQVVAYALDPGGSGVTIRVFINSPYDAYVTSHTRFWQASGIDMSVDAGGVHVHTESVASIIEGGIAFQSFGAAGGPEAAADTRYPLYADEERAQHVPQSDGMPFVMYFQGSLRGLSAGAPVELRGIEIGEVTRLSIQYDRHAGMLRFPVQVELYPQRILGPAAAAGASAPADGRRLIDSMVAHGMRAQLKSGNLLSGGKYVSVDVRRDAPRDTVGWNADPPVFPTTAGALDEIQDSLGDLAKKLDRVPYRELSRRLIGATADLQSLLKRTDGLVGRIDRDLAPEAQATLQQARGALEDARSALAPGAPLSGDLAGTLVELTRAARSVQALADYLERHPEALIRGKPEDRP
jgi:paraquat-inducible protein B